MIMNSDEYHDRLQTYYKKEFLIAFAKLNEAFKSVVESYSNIDAYCRPSGLIPVNNANVKPSMIEDIEKAINKVCLALADEKEDMHDTWYEIYDKEKDTVIMSTTKNKDVIDFLDGRRLDRFTVNIVEYKPSVTKVDAKHFLSNSCNSDE